MSHVTILDLHIKDLAALRAACKTLGLEFVEQPTYRWFGTHVGDYPLPAGFSAADLGKCEFAIRIPGNARAYEVGVAKRRDGKPGYCLLWDFWAGGHGLQSAIGADGVKLRDQYAAEVAAKNLRRKGFAVRIIQTKKGPDVIATK